MTTQARGTFEVKLQPQLDEGVGDPTIGRLSLDKEFRGDLTGTSKGQMLATRTDLPSSAGYVAMERFRGSLAGKSGSFALQHSGTMNRGVSELVVTVVPDSGTDELLGLRGKLTIRVESGQHFYELDYTFGAPS
jgi:hypothetical protein